MAYNQNFWDEVDNIYRRRAFYSFEVVCGYFDIIQRCFYHLVRKGLSVEILNLMMFNSKEEVKKLFSDYKLLDGREKNKTT